MHDHGDAIQSDDGLSEGLLFFVLQGAAGKTDVAAALRDRLDAGAGAGRVIGDGNAFLLLKRFRQRSDDLFHGGGAVGGDGVFLGAAGKAQRSESKGKDCSSGSDGFFHLYDLLSSVWFS